MTDDPGVKDTLSFMIARDTMHQNLWLAAIEDLEQSGLESTPVPSSFPLDLEKREFAYQFWNHSEGNESSEGRWATGRSMDGKGEFQYVANPQPLGPEPQPPQPPAQLHDTPQHRQAQQGNGSSAPPLVERIG
jgi:Mn-containing catalase